MNMKRIFKPAVVVSLRGLRSRARKHWHVGQRVQALVETCPACDGEGCPSGVSGFGCHGRKIQTVVKDGPFGCNAIVPDSMVRFESAD